MMSFLERVARLVSLARKLCAEQTLPLYLMHKENIIALYFNSKSVVLFVTFPL